MKLLIRALYGHAVPSAPLRSLLTVLLSLTLLYLAEEAVNAGALTPVNIDTTLPCVAQGDSVFLDSFELTLENNMSSSINASVSKVFRQFCGSPLVTGSCEPFSDTNSPSMVGSIALPSASNLTLTWKPLAAPPPTAMVIPTGTSTPWHFGYTLNKNPVPTVASPPLAWHSVEGSFKYRDANGNAQSCLVVPKQGLIQTSSNAVVQVVVATPTPTNTPTPTSTPSPTEMQRVTSAHWSRRSTHPGDPKHNEAKDSAVPIARFTAQVPRPIDPQARARILRTNAEDDADCTLGLGITVDKSVLQGGAREWAKPEISIYPAPQVPPLEELVRESPLVSESNRIYIGQLEVPSGEGDPRQAALVCLSYQTLVDWGVISRSGVAQVEGFVVAISWRWFDRSGLRPVMRDVSTLYIGVPIATFTTYPRLFLPLVKPQADLAGSPVRAIREVVTGAMTSNRTPGSASTSIPTGVGPAPRGSHMPDYQ